jgi:hypothetical protein
MDGTTERDYFILTYFLDIVATGQTYLRIYETEEKLYLLKRANFGVKRGEGK